MFQLLLKWLFPWVREGLYKVSLDKFAPPLSVPFRSQKLSLEHGCHFSRLTLLSNEWPYYILFGISLSTSVGPLVRTSSVFLNIPPKDRIPISVVSRVHKAKTCSQKIIRERLRVSRGNLLWNPANFKWPTYCLAFEVEGVHHVILTPEPASLSNMADEKKKWLHGNSEPGRW